MERGVESGREPRCPSAVVLITRNETQDPEAMSTCEIREDQGREGAPATVNSEFNISRCERRFYVRTARHFDSSLKSSNSVGERIAKIEQGLLARGDQSAARKKISKQLIWTSQERQAPTLPRVLCHHHPVSLGFICAFRARPLSAPIAPSTLAIMGRVLLKVRSIHDVSLRPQGHSSDSYFLTLSGYHSGRQRVLGML